MKIVHALLGEHGAMYPLLAQIESTAFSADLAELKVRASCLRSTLTSHAGLEEELLRPAIQQYLPHPAPENGKPEPTDHEVINAGLVRVLRSIELEDARATLLNKVAKTRKHFLKEETVIFQVAERELSNQQQEQLGTEWARRRGVSLT
jgi:hemerythrin-like domain-containing protein